jgi:hypothetical protein
MLFQYRAQQFLSALKEPMFRSGFSDLIALLIKKEILKASIDADLTPIKNDHVFQDVVICLTAAMKIFLFLTLNDITNMVMPLKDTSLGQAGQFSSTVFIYTKKIEWHNHNQKYS